MDNDDKTPPAPSPGVAPAAGTVPAVAADRNLGLAQAATDYFNANGQYTRPLLDNANNTAGRVGAVQADNMDFSRGVAQEAMDFQNTTFRPLTRQIVADAQGYDTAARRESEAADAMGNTGSAIDAEQASSDRALAARGVDPSSGASLAMGRRTAIGAAALKSVAGNTARKQVEQTGYQRRIDANSLGNPLTGNALAASGQSVAAGSAAVNTAAAPLQLANQQLSGATQLINTGVNANTSGGNLMRPVGAGQVPSGGGSGSTDSLYRGLGSLAGAAAGTYFGKAKGGQVGLRDMQPKTGMVNLDVGEYRIPAKHAMQIGAEKLKALNEGRATIMMKRTEKRA